MTYATLRGAARHLSTFRTAILAVLLCACSNAESKKQGAGDSTAIQIALLTPGPISDQAWNGGAYAGLMRIKDSLGARVSHVQTRTPAEFDENFRLYGEQGFAMVVGHGFEYQDAAARVAPEFPKTVYVTTSGNRTGPNLAGLEFAFEDGAYLAGIVAAATSRSGVIGCIGGQEIPPVKRAFYAFEAGARSVNPKITVITSYIGNWDDASAAKEQALALIGRNVDVLFQNADAAGLGVFQAARETPSVRVIGANSDQNNLAPEIVLGSVVIDLPHALLLVAREVQNGTFRPRVISFGLKSDVVKLVINPLLRTSVPESAILAVDKTIRDINLGRFTVPLPPAEPAAPTP